MVGTTGTVLRLQSGLQLRNQIYYKVVPATCISPPCIEECTERSEAHTPSHTQAHFISTHVLQGAAKWSVQEQPVNKENCVPK